MNPVHREAAAAQIAADTAPEANLHEGTGPEKGGHRAGMAAAVSDDGTALADLILDLDRHLAARGVADEARSAVGQALIQALTPLLQATP